jgi:predicted nucleic acid-binding Zn finger protein
MNKTILSAFLSLAIAGSSFALSKSDATQKIKEYIGNSKYVSTIEVCENDKYYIGEVHLEGYENLPNTIRVVFVNKITGDIFPDMGVTHSFCYMLKK